MFPGQKNEGNVVEWKGSTVIALDALCEEIKKLDTYIRELEQRLDIVLNPEINAVKDEVAPARPESKEQVSTLTNRLINIQNDVRDMQDLVLLIEKHLEL